MVRFYLREPSVHAQKKGLYFHNFNYWYILLEAIRSVYVQKPHIDLKGSGWDKLAMGPPSPKKEKTNHSRFWNPA